MNRTPHLGAAASRSPQGGGTRTLPTQHKQGVPGIRAMAEEPSSAMQEEAGTPHPRNQRLLKSMVMFSDLLARGAGNAAELLGDRALRAYVS